MKNLKLLSFLLVLFCTFSSVGQPRLKQKREQIKSLKIAFITDALDLTPEEASKFWPLYNAYEDKQRNFKREKLLSYMESEDNSEIDKMTEKDAMGKLNEIEASETEAFQSRQKFVASLKNILPAKKILKLKKAEEAFKKKLLRQFKERKEGR